MPTRPQREVRNPFKREGDSARRSRTSEKGGSCCRTQGGKEGVREKERKRDKEDKSEGTESA